MTGQRLVERWNAFWFAQGSPVPLGLFRILFACALAREVQSTMVKSTFAIEGGFHLPYLAFLPQLPAGLYGPIHVAQYVAIALLGLGTFPRLACAALLVLQGTVFFADQLNFRNHPYFFQLVLLLLLVSPCAEALSLRALRRRLVARRGGKAPPEPTPSLLTAQRLLQVQVSIVYAFAALQKIHPGYLAGHVLAYHAARALGGGTAGWLLAGLVAPERLERWATWLGQPENLVWPSIASIATELFLAAGLWIRRTRALAIAIGVGFHLSIALLMDIWEFSFAMLASYLLFLDPSWSARRHTK